MKNKKLIFICSPYRSNDKKQHKTNIEYAKALTRWVALNDYTPITPHLYITQALDDNKEEERVIGTDICLSLLSKCDYILIGDSFGLSEGMKKELEYAQEHNIPRLFDSILRRS